MGIYQLYFLKMHSKLLFLSRNAGTKDPAFLSRVLADTLAAAKEAMRRGFDEFLLVGVSGGRLDHTLVNIYLLVMLREQGKQALLVDDYSEMELVGAEPVEIPERFPFYSLVNITGTARGITETGCKFPLDNGEIHCGYQYGTSNEVLPGQIAVVSVKEGLLLLIKDFPEV